MIDYSIMDEIKEDVKALEGQVVIWGGSLCYQIREVGTARWWNLLVLNSDGSSILSGNLPSTLGLDLNEDRELAVT